MSAFQHLYRTIRTLVRQPLLSGTVLAILSLGLGSNILMFMIVDHTFIRPLPFLEMDRLVVIWESQPSRGVEQSSVSSSNFLDWRARSRSFARLAALRSTPFSLRTADSFESVRGALVTQEFFAIFLARPVLGQVFNHDDEYFEGDRAVISDRLWKRCFGADPAILGRTIEIDGRPRTVLGVIPSEAGYPADAEIWLPLQLSGNPTDRGRRDLIAIGVLGEDITLAASREEMGRIAGQLGEEFPETNAASQVRVIPLREELVRGIRGTLSLLVVAFAVILLIICINVSNIFLWRTVSREHELAVNVALGASRWTIMRSILEEVLLLGLAAGGAGIALAAIGRNLLVHLAHDQIPRAEWLDLDYRVVLFTVVIAVGTSSLIALLPASQHLGVHLNAFTSDVLRTRGRRRRLAGLQRMLVVLQLAVVLPLLAVALLLAHSIFDLRNVDLGFNSTNVTTTRLTFPRWIGVGPSRKIQSVDEAIERLRHLPEVQAVGAISELPLSGSGIHGSFLVVDRPETLEPPAAGQRTITPDYFAAMRIPLLEGRYFSEGDNTFGAPVAIISSSLARSLWPDATALGQRIRIGGPDEVELYGHSVEREIVGIVGDVQHSSFGFEKGTEIYLPFAQNPVRSLSLTILSNNPSHLAADVRVVLGDGGGIYLSSPPQSMREMVSRSLGYPEFRATLLGLVGVVSLALVAISIYSVIAHFLQQSWHAIAVRMALGASPIQISRLVLWQGGSLCLGGFGLGLLASWVVVRTVEHYLYLVASSRLSVFIFVTGVVLLMWIAATAIPAWRLLHIKPGSLLHCE